MAKASMVKTVCVDLDGVLAQYDGWRGVEIIGDPIPGAREFLLALCALPAKVCIFTSRTNTVANRDSGLDERELRLLVEDWLVKNDFPFDSIACGEGKPLAAAYVDDRAVVCRPLKDVECHDFDLALTQCRALVSGHRLGAQGSYSDGCLDEHDEGDLKMMIGTQSETVRIDFGKPVGWIALPKEQAVELAHALLKHARTL